MYAKIYLLVLFRSIKAKKSEKVATWLKFLNQKFNRLVKKR